jgi:hypothetical protein
LRRNERGRRDDDEEWQQYPEHHQLQHEAIGHEHGRLHGLLLRQVAGGDRHRRAEAPKDFDLLIFIQAPPERRLFLVDL